MAPLTSGERLTEPPTAKRPITLVLVLCIWLVADFWSDDPRSSQVSHGEAVSAKNTGWVGAGVDRNDLTLVGPIMTTHDNQIIDLVHVSGPIVVRHDDVVIRRCLVDLRRTAARYAIDLGTSTGTVIEHCEIIGASDAAAGVVGGNYTLSSSDIHGFRVGAHLRTGATVQYSRIWDERSGPGVHGNSVVTSGGSDLTIFRNNLEGSSTSALSLYASFAPVRDVLVKENLFNGDSSSYCLYGTADKTYSSESRNVHVVDNLFGRTYSPTCGEFGTHAAWDAEGVGMAWCGNAWQDNGEAVGTDQGCPESAPTGVSTDQRSELLGEGPREGGAARKIAIAGVLASLGVTAVMFSHGGRAARSGT